MTDMKINNILSPCLLTAVSLSLSVLPVSAAVNAVNLGTAGDHVILAKSGISTTGTTSIVGDMGISPAASTFITGFGLTMDPSGEFSTSSLVNGKIYAADYASPTPSRLTTAVSDMETAYTDAATRANPDFTNFQSGNLNGQTLTEGLYKWTSAVTITNSITIDGNSSAVWIFQIDNRLSLASNANIVLSGGAQASNIFWQTAEGVTLGTSSHFEGIVLTATDVAAQTGATMNALLLSQTAVTLDGNSIQAVPESSAYAAIMGLGMIGFVAMRRRRALA